MDKKLKVMQFVSGFKNGGVEQVLLNYTKLINKHYNVENIIVYQHKADPVKKKMAEEMGNKLIEIPSKRSNIFRHLWVTYKLLKLEKPDIVHAHMSLTNFFPLSVAKLVGIPVRISHSHIAQDEFSHYITPLFKKLNILFATQLMACGKKAGKYMYGQHKFEILYNAINQEKYKYNINWRKQIRNDYGIPLNSIVLGTIGRTVEQKNQKFLVDLFDAYNAQNHDSYLIIVGEGKLSKELDDYINKKESKNKIIRIKNVKSTEKFYSAFDVFLMPSLYEGLPVVAIEAQASGVTTLLSDNIDSSVAFSPSVRFLPITGLKPWLREIKKQKGRKYNFNNNHYDIMAQYPNLYDFYIKAMKEKL